MVTVDLDTRTLAVLIAGLYCSSHDVDSIAIPETVYLYVAKQLEYFLPYWNYDKCTFEDWIKYNLTIIPKIILTDEDIQYLQENTLYHEIVNGNVLLVVSMNIRGVNAHE